VLWGGEQQGLYGVAGEDFVVGADGNGYGRVF
jgi:hypothetical protein